MILKNKTNEIVEEGNFGSIILIATLLSILVSSIRLYQLCTSSDEELYDSMKRVGIAQKVVLNRQIKKEIPGLSKDDRKRLLSLIVDKAQSLDWDEFKKILEETRKL